MKKNGSERQKQKQGKENPGRAGRQKQKKNHELAMITYLFVGLFVLMSGYFVYFEAVLSPDVINNPYNSRQETFAERVVRGSILSSDGTVLAKTNVAEDGTETREYPYGNLFAHVVGYSTMGRTGIESLANFSLLRSNAFIGERISKELQEQKNIGDNVVTTLDLNLQQTAYDALGNQKGAVVVLEVKTGKVLAMVSKPDYDPNRMEEDWEFLTKGDESESVLYNRASQGLYAPGSTFKIITLLEYMREESGYKGFAFDCQGGLTQGDYTIRCYGNTVHGQEDLTDAFAKSCNGAFASIGLSLDNASFKKTCEELLFNTDLPVALPSSPSSFVMGSDAEASEQMMTAIGQGRTVVSPLHMAMIVSSIANDGMLMRPYFIDYVESYTGNRVKTYRPSAYKNLMTEEEAHVLTDYMREVVLSGTGRGLNDLGFPVAGKTGTAEYSSDKTKSHAWFVGFSKTGKDDIAVCVVVEEVGSSSEYSVPMARKIFAAWNSGR